MFDTSQFPKAKKYWYNGQFYDWDQAPIHPMTHGLHYGTSVFEGIRAYPTVKGPAIFRLKEHIDRFFYSAGVAKMSLPWSREEIGQAIKEVIKVNNLTSAYIRPLLFYAYGNLGLVPKFCPIHLVIGAWEWGAYLGDKAHEGVTVYILPWRRLHWSQLDMSAKLGGMYIQSTICGLEARMKGADEAVFLNLEGRIAEGPGENIFIIKDGLLITNDRRESILEGITRSSLLEIAADLGFKTSVNPISKEQFLGADEAFFCGTAVEVVAITQVIDASEGEPKKYLIGSGQVGPYTLKLKDAYHQCVRGQNPAYEKWLTYVYD
ncbi:MAG: branched-chain amino acid transaminase [Candidatus Aminicenantes bacterium]|nr:branched-chain amino acid transaminase [Candidatus Aminicenantes bacterium]